MSKEAIKQAMEALELAQDNLRGHGDNCFLHNAGEYNRCFCGKDSLADHLQSVVEKLDEALAQPQPEIEYCTDYHCAGDCGQPHHQKEMQEFLASQPQQEPAQPKLDVPDLIAGALGVSRGTAYDMMREALAEAQPQQELVQSKPDKNYISADNYGLSYEDTGVGFTDGDPNDGY